VLDDSTHTRNHHDIYVILFASGGSDVFVGGEGLEEMTLIEMAMWAIIIIVISYIICFCIGKGGIR